MEWRRRYSQLAPNNAPHTRSYMRIHSLCRMVGCLAGLQEPRGPRTERTQLLLERMHSSSCGGGDGGWIGGTIELHVIIVIVIVTVHPSTSHERPTMPGTAVLLLMDRPADARQSRVSAVPRHCCRSDCWGARKNTFWLADYVNLIAILDQLWLNVE